MNKFFDYIFYRVYRQYEKWREDYPYPFAEGVVIVVQGFIILSILTVLSMFNILPRKIEVHRTYALISLVVLYLVNHHRYKKYFIELLATYDQMGDPNRKRNGILIILLIVVVILIPMLVGILRHNFGYDI